MKYEAIIVGTVPEPVERLAHDWAAWQNDPSFPYRDDHCINGTRLASIVLANEGVAAKPLSVSAVLFNSFAFDLFQRDVPVAEWPEHAHSLGCDNKVDDRTDSPGWGGHLVLEGDGFVLDVSAGQFYRPGRIEIHGPLAISGALNDDPDQQGLVKLPGGHLWLLQRFPANNRWRQAPGWVRWPDDELEALARFREKVASRIP